MYILSKTYMQVESRDKIGQLLIAERALLAFELNEADVPAYALDVKHDRFITKDSRSPISWSLKSHAYGKVIRDSTISLGYIVWSDNNEVLSYKKMRFSMTGLRDLVYIEVEAAQNQLADLLLVPPDNEVLQGHQRWILDQPSNSSERSRGRRNIFVENSLVIFITYYHKGYSVTGIAKTIYQYLPNDIRELLLYCIWLLVLFLSQVSQLSKIPSFKQESTLFLWGQFSLPPLLSAWDINEQTPPHQRVDNKEARKERKKVSQALRKLMTEEARTDSIGAGTPDGPWSAIRLSTVLSRTFKLALRTETNIQIWRLRLFQYHVSIYRKLNSREISLRQLHGRGTMKWRLTLLR
ncbi:hypothetical protein HZ326_25203 [Fusarium oxysporum f. sp. albedinis]|nr:hypothetical protein HZ326_25203 [Fusarium oxysporum f. sp. albedinis]